nr:hypothetical protein [Caldilineaceae bacterium]
MNRLTRMTCLPFLGLLLSGCMLPPVPMPPSVASGDKTIATDDEAAARLQVPAGFTLNTYYSGLDSPRLMTVGPDGQLYVA